MRMIPDPLYGVTIDDISSLSAIRASLAGMNHMPTARIVFDRQEEVSYYASPIEQLQSVSYLVGSILDSSDVSAVSTSAYTQRTQQFLAAFGAQIDL
jgi:hypothetical protein